MKQIIVLSALALAALATACGGDLPKPPDVTGATTPADPTKAADPAAKPADPAAKPADAPKAPEAPKK